MATKRKPAAKKASAKSARAGKAKKKIPPMRERLAAEYIKNGGNGAKAAIAAGYSPKGARQTAHRVLTSVDIQERIRRAKERAGITPEVVTGVLAGQLLSDIADYLDDNGRVDYEAAKARGVTSQIKKFKVRDRAITNEKGETIGVETIHEIELYSSQTAAKILTGTMGMLKQPAVNPEDVARVKAEIDLLVAEGWSEADARDIVIEAEPRAAQWLQ